MRDSIKLGYKWDLLNILLLFLITSFSLSKPAIKFISNGVKSISSTHTSYSGSLKDLFADNSSIGVLAICTAEGNCKIDGSRTKLYSGHVDPGNRVLNFGWCSNQGRDRGNLDTVDAGCLKRTRSRIPRLVNKLQNAGIKPEQNIEAFINNIDQWNQASPRVSDAFAKKYADALKKGLEGKEAILWARVEAFRKSNGELEAGNSRVGSIFNLCESSKYLLHC